MSHTSSKDDRSVPLQQISTISIPRHDTHDDLSPQFQLPDTSPEPSYPPTSKAIIIIAGLYLTTFLTALDRLIIGVAVPSITDHFHSLGDVGWYGSAYLLTSCAFMLFMGRVYTFYNPKWIYLGSLAIFEVGSAVCGAAPNSITLIVGRAIAGLGNAGLFQGAVIIIIYIVPLHKRPQYMGIGGMVFGIASAVGPLLGGAFTDGPGWRWCFYINLPCGAAVFVILVFFLHIPTEMLQRESTTIKEKANRLDPIGTLFFLPCIICLLLALQWGGVTYNWSNARILVLLILSGILAIVFVFVQKWKGENATVPGRIFFNRSVVAGTWFSLCSGGAMQTLFYFLPIWFQAVKGASAVKSGIMSLPFILGLAITSVLAGILTKRIGYFTPWMILSSIITSVGAGLITTFTPHTAHPSWIGYQALYGLALGMGMQQPSVAAQTVLARKDVSIGASLMQFSQTLGGAVFISVGNNLFNSQLARNLGKFSGIDIDSVAKSGATELRKIVPYSMLSQVLAAYSDALRAPFYLGTALTCLSIFGSAVMEWKSVKQGQQKQDENAGKTKEKQCEQV